MPLITSVSGIRGTVGGAPGEGLTPADVVRFVSAFGEWLPPSSGTGRRKVIVGRDARPSGEFISRLAAATLQAQGIDVIDIGLTTTPTAEMAVIAQNGCGGIMVSASHNPARWNALKLLNRRGEILAPDEGKEVLKKASKGRTVFRSEGGYGRYRHWRGALPYHIDKILALPEVDAEAIRAHAFRIAVDPVNSTGGVAVPMLLEKLGVGQVVSIHGNPDGNFAHDPEPLPAHLKELSAAVVSGGAHLGIAVDPDVDRLAFVCENGEFFGEEYTLVAVADYILGRHKGDTVSNLSSSMALRDIARKAGGEYHASPVGEAHVAALMKEKNAVIGGEGNGGVIFPALHYGRDALAGIALFLTHLAKSGLSCSRLRATYPGYFISKNKIALSPESNAEKLMEAIRGKYAGHPVNTTDGIRIEFENEWVHLRASNTEPVIRIYAESGTLRAAEALAKKFMEELLSP